MSTRSQFRFVQRVEQPDETAGSADRVAQVYRHSDGYSVHVRTPMTEISGPEHVGVRITPSGMTSHSGTRGGENGSALSHT
jgi:hypothetical protein